MLFESFHYTYQFSRLWEEMIQFSDFSSLDIIVIIAMLLGVVLYIGFLFFIAPDLYLQYKVFFSVKDREKKMAKASNLIMYKKVQDELEKEINADLIHSHQGV